MEDTEISNMCNEVYDPSKDYKRDMKNDEKAAKGDKTIPTKPIQNRSWHPNEQNEKGHKQPIHCQHQVVHQTQDIWSTFPNTLAGKSSC